MNGLGYLLAWHLLACIAPLVNALRITAVKFNGTDRPTPRTIIHFETQGTATASDPIHVDIFLRNTGTQRQDLAVPQWTIKGTPNAGFPIPDQIEPGASYVLRMTDSNTQVVVADSVVFEIFPIGTPPSPEYEQQQNTPAPEAPTEPSVPLGPIIGGVVGGVAIIVIFFVLLWFLLRKPKKRQQNSRSPPNPDPQAPHPNPASAVGPDGKPLISPFIIPSSTGGNTKDSHYGSHIEAYPLTSPTSQSSGFSAREEKARLAAQSARESRHRTTTSGHSAQNSLAHASHDGSGASDPLLSRPQYPPSVGGDSKRSLHSAQRADQLRRERERIDREIADLESQSVFSGTGSSNSRNRPVSEDVMGQIAALREQVARMENRGYTQMDEPPPEYVPSSSPLPKPGKS
ncbi:hypothetical protein FA15DRAFT_665593 [Coprinopsis marcescibilis]|uniref:Dystroglycan-type cadherin-like domain-containing protein n=1 Tax=Coprinopsis marcescibilis TaxID=230819 RepID=A0A5C3L620_COPMA|nr:hypothetical protein FA15DRAFT_665593 [Coprinopsis marcescibilis]